LGTLEQDLQREMGTLSREVREAVAELRQGPPQLGARQPWSLDNVVRLHNELRADGASSSPGGRSTLALAEAVDVEAMPHTGRERPHDAREQQVVEVPAASAPSGARWFQWVAGSILAAVVVFAIYVQAQVRTGLQDATARAAAAERGAEDARQRAARDIAAAQQAADTRLLEARQAARAAQMLALIASSADLLRFDLKGQQGQAQVLWSRSQGVAVNATGLGAPPPDKTYQLWLITPGQATSAGILQVDATGRASAVFDSPAELPRPVRGAAVTMEPSGGSPAPTGSPVLAPAVPAPAVAAPPAP
jgi:hypothetical protein